MLAQGHRERRQRATSIARYLALILLSALAVRRTGTGLKQLFLGSLDLQNLASAASTGPVDLACRLLESVAWWQGHNVYREMPGANYPPATLVMFAPLTWMPLGEARVAFGALSLASLGILLLMLLTTARVPWRMGVAFGITVCASNCVGTTFAFGQLGLISLASSIGAILLAKRRGLASVVFCSILMTLALVKPSSAGIFWIAILVLRPTAGALSAILYSLVTVAGTTQNSLSLLDSISEWMHAARTWSDGGVIGYGSVTNLRWVWPVFASPLVSIVLAVAFGVWAFRHRLDDPLRVIGVASILSRVWTFHRGYDDLLLFPAALAIACLPPGATPLPQELTRALAFAVLGHLIAPHGVSYLTEWTAPAIWLLALGALSLRGSRRCH